MGMSVRRSMRTAPNSNEERRPRHVDLNVHLGDDPAERSGNISFDVEGVHVIRWEDPITASLSRLPEWLTTWKAVRDDEQLQATGQAKLCGSGSCTLVIFPMITFQKTGETRVPTPSELCVLVAIILDLTCMRLPSHAAGLVHDTERNPGCASKPELDIEYVMNVPDITGARVIHSLQLASAAAAGGHSALQLVYTILTFHPSLMTANHLAGGPIQAFKGENCMHIAAVNKQERVLCAMINLAKGQLTKSERVAVFTSKCEGPFFLTHPQCFYGGTVLGFAATHGLKKAVVLLAGMQQYTGGLNADTPDGGHSLAEYAREHSCALSGFLPLHAVVACGERFASTRAEQPIAHGHPDVPLACTLYKLS